MAFDCNYLPSVIIFNIYRYLSPSDRLRASATCRTWRECLFQSSQWPYKRLAIDLCRRADSVYAMHSMHSMHTMQTSMQSMPYTLRRNNSNSNNSKAKNRSKTLNHSYGSHDSTPALNCFLHKCSRFLNDLMITFNPNSTQNLNQLIQIMDILLSNEEYNHYNNDNNNNNNNKNLNNYSNLNQSMVKNSRCLRRLTLNPIDVTKGLDNSMDEKNAKTYELFRRLVERLEQLMQRMDSLEHISFGCLQQVLNHSNRLLSILAKHSLSLRCLHLSSVKADPDYYPVLDLSVQLLEPFANLKQLSIDFDVVNDQLLALMARKGTIDTLVINVHGIDEEHEGVSKSSWDLLVKSSPDLKVTVNLIHTDDSIAVLRDSLFDTDMPLAHFRAFFVGRVGANDTTICYLINLVANRHSKTLLSVTLVTALKETTLDPNPVFAELQENPLVMLAWRCRRLHSLTVIGYEVCDSDLIAITRLRGSRLKQFRFPLCCISLLHSPIAEDEGYYDEYYVDRQSTTYFLDCAQNHIQTKVIEDIAEPLNRKWNPMAFEELPNAVINGFGETQTTYLSTILADQTICGECESDTNRLDSSSQTIV